MDAGAQLKRLVTTVRATLLELFDQSKPFGRLAMVHSLMSAGVTALTVGLAGTLFFSIKPNAAEGKVLLYLLITIAPFAVVAPALSPFLDKGRQARRTATAIAAGGSALLCLAMAADINSPLLFPEAFGILVMSKLYLVTRAALVPAVIAPGEDLASCNARLAVLAGIAGFAVSPIAVGFLQAGAADVMFIAAIVFGAATFAAFRLPRGVKEKLQPVGAPGDDPDATMDIGHDGSTMPYPTAAGGPAARPGPGAGLVTRPAQGFEPRRQASAASDRPLISEPAYGPQLPSGAEDENDTLHTPSRNPRRGRRSGSGLGVLSPRLDVHSPPVTLALAAVSAIRASIGFVTFFLAFALKRETPPAATWLYGLIVLASGVGGLAGSLSVPYLRRHMSEERIIMFSLLVAATFAGLAAFIGGLWAQPLLTAVIGLTGTTSKPSFDSLAQRHTPPLQQGRAFAKFETRLQLVWVIAAVMAVVVKFNFGDGDVVIAVACAISAVFYGSVSQSVARHASATT